eukprot:2003132-Prymnesium_polylepis.1
MREPHGASVHACIKIELAARDGAVAELALAQLLGELGRALGKVGVQARTEQLPKEEGVADQHERLGRGVLHLRPKRPASGQHAHAHGRRRLRRARRAGCHEAGRRARAEAMQGSRVSLAFLLPRARALHAPQECAVAACAREVARPRAYAAGYAGACSSSASMRSPTIATLSPPCAHQRRSTSSESTAAGGATVVGDCLLYTSPSPRDAHES